MATGPAAPGRHDWLDQTGLPMAGWATSSGSLPHTGLLRLPERCRRSCGAARNMRELFGDGVDSLEMTRKALIVDRFETPNAWPASG